MGGAQVAVLEASVLFGLVHTHDVGCAGVRAKRQGPWLGLRLPSQGVGAALSSGPVRPCVPFGGQGVLERSALDQMVLKCGIIRVICRASGSSIYRC